MRRHALPHGAALLLLLALQLHGGPASVRAYPDYFVQYYAYQGGSDCFIWPTQPYGLHGAPRADT